MLWDAIKARLRPGFFFAGRASVSVSVSVSVRKNVALAGGDARPSAPLSVSHTQTLRDNFGFCSTSVGSSFFRIMRQHLPAC
jgi:hypothetical protein